MGLAEHVRAGARLTRDIITITDTVGSGSIDLGATYVITNIETSVPARVRLYDTEASRDHPTEINRSFDVKHVSPTISLIGDFTSSTSQILSVDPVVIGHSQTFTSPQTFYRVTPSGSTIRVFRYLLENNTVPPTVGSAYSKDNRRILPSISATNVDINQYETGVISDLDIPRTYLLISASLSNPAHIARLRLYAVSSSVFGAQELAREFSVEPDASVRLITDVILSGSTPLYFTPKVIGVNTQTLENSLIDIRGDQSKINSVNELYYVLQNVSTTSGSVTIDANVYVYSLED